MTTKNLLWTDPLDKLDRTLYDATEVHPCVLFDVGGEVCEEVTTDPTEADIWVVYLHFKTGGIDCAANFKTKAEAEAYRSTLDAWLKKG